MTYSDRSSVVDEVVSLATTFRQNGYATYAVGKRHTYNNVDEGWAVKYSHNAYKSSDENYIRWIDEQGYLKEFAMEAYTALKTREIIKKHAGSDTPFFC